MQAPRSARLPQRLLTGAAVLGLAACGGGGGGNGIGGVSGSSSGGGNSSVLAGTFTTQTGNSKRVIGGTTTDTPVFGAVDGQGNGFLADMSMANAGNQAVFRLTSASQPNAGTVSGSYDAFYTGGSNNTIILGGALTGTYTASAADLSFGTSNGPSDTATLVLDSPALAVPSSITGTYTAQVGSTSGNPAISTSTNQADIYTVSVSNIASGTTSVITLAVNDSSGCNFTSTSVTAVGGLDVYDVAATGTCPSTTGGNANNITLTGLAVYLPAGSKSPLGTGPLSQPALLLEMDDSTINTGAPKNAFVLLAVQ